MGEEDEIGKMKKQYSEYQKLFNRSKGSHISTHNNPQNDHILRGTKRFDQTDSQALMYMQSTTNHGRVMHFADHIIRFPKKERFNQDLDESVKEIKHGLKRPIKTLNRFNLNNESQFDIKSQLSKMSQISKGSKFNTMTKDDLKLYFKEKQEQLEEDSKSRISMISRGQFGKKDFSIKKDRKPQALSQTNSALQATL